MRAQGWGVSRVQRKILWTGYPANIHLMIFLVEKCRENPRFKKTLFNPAHIFRLKPQNSFGILKLQEKFVRGFGQGSVPRREWNWFRAHRMYIRAYWSGTGIQWNPGCIYSKSYCTYRPRWRSCRRHHYHHQHQHRNYRIPSPERCCLWQRHISISMGRGKKQLPTSCGGTIENDSNIFTTQK